MHHFCLEMLGSFVWMQCEAAEELLTDVRFATSYNCNLFFILFSLYLVLKNVYVRNSGVVKIGLLHYYYCTLFFFNHYNTLTDIQLFFFKSSSNGNTRLTLKKKS